MILISIPEQIYTPRVINAAPVVPAGIKQLVLKCTRVAWALGPVGTISVNYPNGDAAGGIGFSGGVIVRNGQVVAASTMTLVGRDGGDLPAGTYAATIEILQTVVTAVTVEGL